MTDHSDSDVVEGHEKVQLTGWTKGDKFDLLQGIKKFGSNDIASISKLIPHKTLPEIGHAVQLYKNRALKKYFAKKEVSKGPKNSVIRVAKSSAPLSNWASILVENFGTEALQTETVTAMRMIADCEDRPHPVNTESFDFAKAYHMVADAMEGKSIKNDKDLEMLLNHCIHETAKYSRSFIKKPVLRNLLDNCTITAEDFNRFPQPSSNTEAATVSHLAVQKNYNPIKIPEDYLKVSKYN